MPYYCRIILPLFLSLLPGWVRSQILLPLDGFGVTAGIKKDDCHLPGGYQVRYLFKEPLSSPDRRFQHVVLDARQQPRHQCTLRVGGRATQLVGTGFNQQAALYRFQTLLSADDTASNDSVLTAVIDTAGRVLSLQRHLMTKYQEFASEIPLVVSSDSLLLLSRSFGYGLKTMQLQCFDLQQRERWSLLLKSTERNFRLVNSAADSAYVWLVVLENSLSRQATSTAYCIELKTGRITAAHGFDYDSEKRIPTSLIMRPNHSLFVAGRVFHDERVRWRAERLFAVTLPAVCEDSPTATP